MKRKLLAIIMIAVLVLSLAGCSKKEEVPENTPSATETAPTEAASPTEVPSDESDDTELPDEEEEIEPDASFEALSLLGGDWVLSEALFYQSENGQLLGSYQSGDELDSIVSVTGDRAYIMFYSANDEIDIDYRNRELTYAEGKIDKNLSDTTWYVEAEMPDESVKCRLTAFPETESIAAVISFEGVSDSLTVYAYYMDATKLPYDRDTVEGDSYTGHISSTGQTDRSNGTEIFSFDGEFNFLVDENTILTCLSADGRDQRVSFEDFCQLVDEKHELTVTVIFEEGQGTDLPALAVYEESAF